MHTASDYASPTNGVSLRVPRVTVVLPALNPLGTHRVQRMILSLPALARLRFPFRRMARFGMGIRSALLVSRFIAKRRFDCTASCFPLNALTVGDTLLLCCRTVLC